LTGAFAAADFQSVETLCGEGLRLDGGSTVLTWTYAAQVQNSFTVEFVVRPREPHSTDLESPDGTRGTTGQRYIFDATFVPAPDAGVGISLGTNGIAVYEHSAGYMPALLVINAQLSPLKWHHITLVYADQQPSIYIDGVFVKSGLQSVRRNSFAPVQLGGGAYGSFPGDIDEVSIYSEVLAPEQIRLRCEQMNLCSKTSHKVGMSEFRFLGTKQTDVFVTLHGVLSLGTEFSSWTPGTTLSTHGSIAQPKTPVIAALWSTYAFPCRHPYTDASTAVWWRKVTAGPELTFASTRVQDLYGQKAFVATEMLIVTYIGSAAPCNYFVQNYVQVALI
jgi:hypothetical protein